MKENVGEYLVRLLKERNMSEAKLAEALKVSRPMVTYILKGERALSLKQALRLERIFNLKEGSLLHMQVSRQIKDYKEALRNSLISRLSSANAFWSYPLAAPEQVSDDEIIEKTFTCLDVEDISAMFELYSKAQIKKVWLEKMVPQGDYLRRLNIMIAYIYFDIDNPERYILQQETKQLNKRLKNAKKC